MNDATARRHDLFDHLRQNPLCLVRSEVGTGITAAIARYVAEVAQQNEDQPVAVISYRRALVAQWTAELSKHSEGHVGAISSTADLIEVLDEQAPLPAGVTVLYADLLTTSGTLELLTKRPLKLLVIEDLQSANIRTAKRHLGDLVSWADQTVALIQDPLDIPGWASTFHVAELPGQPAPPGPRRHVYKVTERECSIFRDAEWAIEQATSMLSWASSWPVLHDSLLRLTETLDREIPASDLIETLSGKDSPYWETFTDVEPNPEYEPAQDPDPGGPLQPRSPVLDFDTSYGIEDGSAWIWAVIDQVERVGHDQRLDAVLEVIADANSRPCVVSVANQIEAHYIAGFLTDAAYDNVLVLDPPKAAAVFSEAQSDLPEFTITTFRLLQGVELPADSVHLIWSVEDPEVPELMTMLHRGGETVLLVSDPALPPDERIAQSLRSR